MPEFRGYPRAVCGSIESVSDALGSCFYWEFAVGPDGPQESDLFASFLVAETAEADGPLSGFRHEPRSLDYRFGILAPGTLDGIAWEKSDLTQVEYGCRIDEDKPSVHNFLRAVISFTGEPRSWDNWPSSGS